jgi:putative redox protein
MKVELIRKNDAFHFDAYNEAGNVVSLDANEQIGGEGKGFRPMETLLAGLGGCSAIDVLLILKKQRQQVAHCSITIEANRKEGELISVFEKIHVHFRLSGNLLPEKVEKALSLSFDKYCSVAAILDKTAQIEYSYEIQQA